METASLSLKCLTCKLIGTQGTAQYEIRDATEDGIKPLPHMVDSVPFIVWIALVAGASKRFTFYANYMQNDRDSIAVPGVLGLGQATATNIPNALFFFLFLAPLPFAVVSDPWRGRYKTLCISYILNLCGCIVLFITSLLVVSQDSIKTFRMALAMVLLNLGARGVKTTVSPFIGDQYTTLIPQLVATKKAERVIADRTFTNIGSLSPIASTYLEKEVGFWATNFLPLCSALLLLQDWKFLASSARERFRLDAAKPTFQAEKYGGTVPWDNLFILVMQRGLIACKVMACFVPFYLCINQITNNLVSQVALNPIACILLGPIIQKKLLYPCLQKQGVPFGPITRMNWFFVTISSEMAFAAGLQKPVYTPGVPNNISIWVQTPILGLATLSEYSYSKALKDMRSLVQALRQVTAGTGSTLGMATWPIAVNPKMMYMYTGLVATMVAVAPAFWVAPRRLMQPDSQEEMEETSANARPRGKGIEFAHLGYII
ncbi:hypothetical protein BDV27DRAFT_151002 [Aspergillus caelatus]|uniref:Major facilitator superfamily domain-containing protein n=1 Tax=Aspergillus caelatus TaxID=61420 RepID=A0A5N6ZKS2_9EURO|nr:uncharacterized protein BDV27DRAFT_151002 [Aspergillus caelatus]KAE8357813.1 hypothetical protein BDV27DRAFT_151002 [Aspergillus caelatus]